MQTEVTGQDQRTCAEPEKSGLRPVMVTCRPHRLVRTNEEALHLISDRPSGIQLTCGKKFQVRTNARALRQIATGIQAPKALPQDFSVLPPCYAATWGLYVLNDNHATGVCVCVCVCARIFSSRVCVCVCVLTRVCTHMISPTIIPAMLLLEECVFWSQFHG